jgi:hypothetical protein
MPAVGIFARMPPNPMGSSQDHDSLTEREIDNPCGKPDLMKEFENIHHASF